MLRRQIGANCSRWLDDGHPWSEVEGRGYLVCRLHGVTRVAQCENCPDYDDIYARGEKERRDDGLE